MFCLVPRFRNESTSSPSLSFILNFLILKDFFGARHILSYWHRLIDKPHLTAGAKIKYLNPSSEF